MRNFSFISLIFATFVFLNPLSKGLYAEYRVYQYYIRPKPNSYSQDSKAYFIESTLPPVSYIAYHGGKEAFSIDLLRTWICPGYTGGNPICENPYKNMNRVEALEVLETAKAPATAPTEEVKENK